MEEYKEDMYVDGNAMFFKFYQHSIDYNRVHTIKSHLLTEKHKA